jgi:hypothetical protein
MCILAVLVILMVLCAACSSSQSTDTEEYRGQLIYQLEEARDADKRAAFDPNVGPVTVGDFMIQAERAQAAADTIRQGGDLSRSDLHEALFVPPKSLSDEQRSQLIGELEMARRLDRRGQADWTRDPLNQQDFRVQELKATRAIRKLRAGQPISWIEISTAKEIPWDP